MAVTINTAQINSAAKGNQDLRETLTSVALSLQSLQQQTGAAPLQKVDTTPTKFSGPPPACGLTVRGANGQFSVTITLPQSTGASSTIKNPTNAPIYQELSSASNASFTSGVTTYPLSTNTSYTFPNPGASLYWRLRSSYDQKTFNNYQVQPGGAVDAGKQTSAATASNVSLNQSNFATVDSVANGSAATVRIYGSGGAGSSWVRVVGSSSQVIPAGTILNVAYGSNQFVAWDGSQYQLAASLTQTFPDNWIPVGSVSVIANGTGQALPTIEAVVVNGAIVAYQIVNPGNDLTAAPTITITDTSGKGATATAVVEAGSVTQLVPGNAGSGYSSSPTVTATGGVSGGTSGGGGATGTNGGRLYANA